MSGLSGGQTRQAGALRVGPMPFDLLGEEKLCPSQSENGANTGMLGDI